MKCPKCHSEVSRNSNFCLSCGKMLLEDDKSRQRISGSDAERKYVTILFSDMSGYTTMSENLDPEEVKEITSRIFDEISKVITQYSGFIEKYVGDAVMAIFGAPIAQEDDPVRAIKAAQEIHTIVSEISPEYEPKIETSLVMHTGVNTGLVVTGEVNLEKGTHGLTGDAINVAARLSGIAAPDQIVVGQETYQLAEGHFTFEALEPTTLKGKKDPVKVYRVIRLKETPCKVHRLHGLRAEYIGRKWEIKQLTDAVDRLCQGHGAIISICGEAGTGKSRLVEEFRKLLDFRMIQWQEGHANAYTQNRPYAPVIDLLSRAFSFEEGDPPNTVKRKLETRLQSLVGKDENIIPYIGSLFSLYYPELEDVSPEFWKSRLREALKTIVTALARGGPLIICFEDLHWADPSTVDLIRHLLSKSTYAAMFICVYRPGLKLFTPDERNIVGSEYTEILLQDLSPSETNQMAASLLDVSAIPFDLSEIFQHKSEGNPFYLEELINSLIEADLLVRDNESWKFSRTISETDIPSTIQGVLTARLDRLEPKTKRTLQEASVIGRSFFYVILRKITDLKNQIDDCLGSLVGLDLIRIRTQEPDLEYIFKHALTQEAVYNGLLKKERREIHERIGRSIEIIFQDRLSEFYETLSIHFSRGQSTLKAVDYLAKSADKGFKQFALEEAHTYYRQAFELLNNKMGRTLKENHILLDLIIKWALVYNHRGDFKGLNELLVAFEDFAVSLNDSSKLGIYYAWLGFTIWIRGKAKDGFSYLNRSLRLGEETNNNIVIGYACTWLSWVCWDLGHLNQGKEYSARALELQKRLFPTNHYIHYSSLGGWGHICSATGERKKALEIGEKHLDYGEKHGDVRSKVFGYIDLGFGYFIEGDFVKAGELFREAYQLSPDPFFANYAQFWLGASYLMGNRVDDALDQLQEVLKFSYNFGTELFSYSATSFLGLGWILKGNLGKGMKLLNHGVKGHFKDGRKSLHALLEHTLGKVYLQMAQGEGPKRLSFMMKNIGFLFRNIPFAKQNAEKHLKIAIDVSREIGANFSLAMALMDMGILYKMKKKPNIASKNLTEAIKLFEECGANSLLNQAKEILVNL